MLSVSTSLKFCCLGKAKSLDCEVPDSQILDLSKLKAFGDDKFSAVQIMAFVFEEVEDNYGYQHFLLFPQCFYSTLPRTNFSFLVICFVISRCFEFVSTLNFVLLVKS